MSEWIRTRRRARSSKAVAALVVAVLCVIALWQWYRGVRQDWLATATPAALSVASARDPNDIELLYSLAYKLVQFGKYDEAADRMERLVHIEPNSSRHWLGLARAAAGAGRTVRASEAYQKAAALQPRAAAPRYSLAQMYAEAGLVSDALHLYEDAARLGPATSISDESRARCLSKVGRDAEAWSLIHSVITAAPMQDSAYALAGELARRLPRYDEGEKLLRYRIGLTRGYPAGVARAPLARLLVARSNSPEVLREAEQLARVAAKDPAPQPAFSAALADVLMAKGDLHGACRTLESVTKGTAPDPECIELLARAYERLGSTSRATSVRARLDSPEMTAAELDSLRVRSAKNPDDTASRLALAIALSRARLPAEAAEQCHAVIRREPGNQTAIELLAACRVAALETLGEKRTPGPGLDPSL